MDDHARPTALIVVTEARPEVDQIHVGRLPESRSRVLAPRRSRPSVLVSVDCALRSRSVCGFKTPRRP